MCVLELVPLRVEKEPRVPNRTLVPLGTPVLFYVGDSPGAATFPAPSPLVSTELTLNIVNTRK